MDKLHLDDKLFLASLEDWIKSIPLSLDKYSKEIYHQINISPLYYEQSTDILSFIKEDKDFTLDETENQSTDIVFSTKKFHQNGANPIQEIAFTLAYISNFLHKKNEDEGKEIIDSFQLEVFVDTDFFGSIAKIKAFKLLVPTIIKEFIHTFEIDQHITISAVTSTKTISKEESKLNHIRKTIEVIAAILGEADFVKIIPYDKSDSTDRGINNIKHLLVHESKINEIQNLMNGSFFIEELTKEICIHAWNQFLQIKNIGGLQEFIDSGELENELNSEKEKLIEGMMSGEYKLVGFNAFRDAFNPSISPSKWIDNCYRLSLFSWDCLILEGASEQEEELIKNVLYTLHSIGLKNKMDANVLFIAGDEKKINQFEKLNPLKKIIRIVEELNEEDQLSMSSLFQLPNLIDEIVFEEDK